MSDACWDADALTGYWKIIDDCEKFVAECSVCGRKEDSRVIRSLKRCPECGARLYETLSK